MRARVIAVIVLVSIVLACALAPVFDRYASGTDPFRTDPLGVIPGSGIPVLPENPGGLGTIPAGPGLRWSYALGADSLGRDVAARLLHGGRASLLVAGAATVLCLGFGVAIGVAAGVGGPVADTLLSGVMDLVWAFPATLLAISLALVLLAAPVELWGVAVAQDSLALPIVIIGLVFTPYVARPVRAALRDLRGAAFIEAARATGGSPWHILRRHLVPQLVPLVGGLLPIMAATTLLTEAGLSALGLGVQPPGVSWGSLIVDGQALLHQRPLVAVAPGLAIVAVVLALNALAPQGTKGTQGAQASRVGSDADR